MSDELIHGVFWGVALLILGVALLGSLINGAWGLFVVAALALFFLLKMAGDKEKEDE